MADDHRVGVGRRSRERRLRSWSTTSPTPEPRELRACALRAVADVRGGPLADGASLAVLPYDDGFLAMALRGVVDERAGGQLLGVLADVRWQGRHELLVELAELVRATPAVMRFIGYLRLQQVTMRGRLELHHPPADLVAGLAGDGADSLWVHDPRPPVRPL